MDDVVISAGGGAVIDEENATTLKSNGVIVCLTATAQIIYDRVKHESHRPLLRVSDPMAKINELMDERLKYYQNTSDHTIDTSALTLDEVAEKIIEEVNIVS